MIPWKCFKLFSILFDKKRLKKAYNILAWHASSMAGNLKHGRKSEASRKSEVGEMHHGGTQNRNCNKTMPNTMDVLFRIIMRSVFKD